MANESLPPTIPWINFNQQKHLVLVKICPKNGATQQNEVERVLINSFSWLVTSSACKICFLNLRLCMRSEAKRASERARAVNICPLKRVVKPPCHLMGRLIWENLNHDFILSLMNLSQNLAAFSIFRINDYYLVPLCLPVCKLVQFPGSSSLPPLSNCLSLSLSLKSQSVAQGK